MANIKTYPIKPEIAKSTHVNAEQYSAMYEQSVANPDEFWAEQAEQLNWHKKWDKVSDWSFAKGDVHIKWFEGGKLNISDNCIDRHLATKADKPAIIFEPNNPSEPAQTITYAELHKQVCVAANMLKKLGVKSGDRVTIYMPMIPEAAYAMLACSRIGAIHSVVFGGFSPEALRGRILDCDSQIVITADGGFRGEKTIALKANVDEACIGTNVSNVLVVKRTKQAVNWQNCRDAWWHELATQVDDNCEAESFDAEHPLFILYTSGSTGKPKGLLHTSAGYLLYAMFTFKTVFDYRDDEVFWCTADVGWITGHSYIIYGPLAAGATTVMFEGVPNYPDASRFWQVVDKHNVNSFYTAPTAIRMLMRAGEDYVKPTSRASLRVLGSVGEPINPEAWEWYYNIIGEQKCPIVDTWWQTETGGHMLTPLIGATPLKAGSATQPFFGVEPVLLNDKNQPVAKNTEAALCIKSSWPAQARTIWGDHKRFVETYFSAYPNHYFSGDAAAQDDDGDYWIKGRMDDVLNVSGHRLGTAEIESALVAHSSVTEAAVVGIPHEIKGEAIYAFVTLAKDFVANDELINELKQWVRKEIGAIATPEHIQFATDLPKTRSGKIMRRILRKIAGGDITSKADYTKLGDTSTLLNPEAIDELVNRKNRNKL